MGEQSKGRLVTSRKNPGEVSYSSNMLTIDSQAKSDLQVENETLRAQLAELQQELRDSDHQQQVELESMRDLLAALVKAVSLDQTLEVVLVNLRNLVAYDVAGLFLLSENGISVQNRAKSLMAEQGLMTFPNNHPLVAELQITRSPLVIHDVQSDSRFRHWDEMQLINSWLGAPLFVREEMVGFISLGSLQHNAYQEIDTDLIAKYTEQLAGLLDKVWQGDQSQRKTKEFEVLSRLSFALGQADSKEDTFSTIVDQIKKLFGPAEGTFLFPDKAETELIVKFTDNNPSAGSGHLYKIDDLLWRVYQTGKSSLISDVREFLGSDPPIIYHNLLSGKKSAVVIPLISHYSPFGVLLVAFSTLQIFSPEDILLLDTITRVTSTTLQRMFALESLEKQLEERTEQLSALYKINTIASKPLPLVIALEQILELIAEVTKCQAGVIHLVDTSVKELHLVVQHGLQATMLAPISRISTSDPFWSELARSNDAFINKVTNESANGSGMFPLHTDWRSNNFISTHIHAKNQPLGMLTMFGNAVLDYTAEDITLFMTVADEIGSYIERTRLIEEAEQTAVIKERQRLARELHDSVTQSLYSQVLFAGAGLKVLRNNDLSLSEQYLTRIHQEARQALREMRLLVYELRLKDYLEEGLIEALQRRLDAVERRSDINASLLVEGRLNLDESTEIGLYFIAMEALNNVLKHSGATTVQIDIVSTQDYLKMKISDNGCGFDLQNRDTQGGIGLASMRERADVLHGDLHIITEPGQGAQVIVEITGSQ